MTGMKPMKRFYYRAYQTVFDLGSRVLPWRKPEIVSGAGSTARIPELLRSCGFRYFTTFQKGKPDFRPL